MQRLIIAFTSISLVDLINMPFYYAVARGRTVGVYNSWDECKKEVTDFIGAKFRKFSTEKEARDFIIANSSSTPKKTTNSSPLNSPVAGSSGVNSHLLSEINALKTTAINLQKNLTQYVKKKETEIKNLQNAIGNLQFRILSGGHIPLLDMQAPQSISSNSFNRVGFGKRPGSDEADGKPFGTKLIKLSHESIGIKMEVEEDGVPPFRTDEEGYVTVYTDGSCEGNGTPTARAGIGVWFNDNHPLNASEPVRGRATNNTAEIQAAAYAIELAKGVGISKLNICSDSEFLINSITKWMHGWKKNGWKLKNGGPVKNKEDFELLDEVMKMMDIKWNHVRGHQGIHGNECADRLANAGAERYGMPSQEL